MIYLWLSSFLVFFTILVIVMLVQYTPLAQRQYIARRIKNYAKGPEFFESKTRTSFSLKQLLEKASSIAPRGLAEKMDIDLIKAGVPLKGQEALTIWLLLLLIPAAIVFILSRDVVNTGLVISLAFALPYFLLRNATSKRLQEFNNQISDALLIMANSMRAGFSFLQALEMVAKEMKNPIAGEVQRVLREMHLGVPVDQALINMGQRVGSKDFDLVITAILIQRQVGGNLAEILDNISFTIRERIQLTGEVKVLTAQGKISGLVIGLLPICLTVMLYLVNKEYILLLFTDPRGLMMVGGALISQVIGFIFVRRIVDIKL